MSNTTSSRNVRGGGGGESSCPSAENQNGGHVDHDEAPLLRHTKDAPMFHMLFRHAPGPLRTMLQGLYAMRAVLARPLAAPILPRRLSACLPVWLVTPFQSLFGTPGQLLLTLPLVIFFCKGYHYTFSNPLLDFSGREATHAIYWAFLTATKSNSVFAVVLGIPFERLIALHHLSALVAVVLGCFHVYVAFKYGGDDDGDSVYADFGTDPNLVQFVWDGNTNRSGTVLLGALGAMVLLSQFAIVRRLLFNLWYTTHILLGVLTLVGLFWHDVSSAVFVTGWWALDVAVRYGVMALWQYRIPNATLRKIGSTQECGNSEREPHQVALEICIPKPAGFDFNAGQFVQVAVPALGVYEFHPLTLSSAPHEANLTLHVRALGDWSRRLVQLAANQPQATTTVVMEGPYGACAVDVQNQEHYTMVLLVSGGIGVTPCQSIGKALLYQQKQRQQARNSNKGQRDDSDNNNLKYLRYVWSVRDLEMVNDIPPLGGGQDFSTTTASFSSPTRSLPAATHTQRSSPGSEKAASPASDYSIEVTDKDVPSSSKRPGRPRQQRSTTQVDIYCTRGGGGSSKTKDDEEEKGQHNDDLPYNLHYGRPDLDALFLEVKETALQLGEANVAVIGCGPPALMKKLRECCVAHSASLVGCDQNIFFDLHTETFEF